MINKPLSGDVAIPFFVSKNQFRLAPPKYAPVNHCILHFGELGPLTVRQAGLSWFTDNPQCITAPIVHCSLIRRYHAVPVMLAPSLVIKPPLKP